MVITIDDRVEAQELTNRIKANLDNLGELLAEAKNKRVWRTLGYASWYAYVREEFHIHWSYANRLIHQGEVNRELASAAGLPAPMGADPYLPERQTRRISPAALPEAAERVREAVAGGVNPVLAMKDTIKIAAMERAALSSFNDPTVQLERLNHAIETMRQKWDLTAIVPAIIEIHGRRDVDVEIERLSMNINTLVEIREVMMGSLAREAIS